MWAPQMAASLHLWLTPAVPHLWPLSWVAEAAAQWLQALLTSVMGRAAHTSPRPALAMPTVLLAAQLSSWRGGSSPVGPCPADSSVRPSVTPSVALALYLFYIDCRLFLHNWEQQGSCRVLCTYNYMGIDNIQTYNSMNRDQARGQEYNPSFPTPHKHRTFKTTEVSGLIYQFLSEFLLCLCKWKWSQCHPP